MIKFLFCFFIISSVWASNPSIADLTRIRLQAETEQKQSKDFAQKAKTVEKEISSVQKQMIDTAKKVQNLEDNLSSLEEKLASLSKERDETTAQFIKNRTMTISLLSGLQKMALHPPESMFFTPNHPVDNIRTSLLLKNILIPLNARIVSLKNNLNTINSLTLTMNSQLNQIKETSTELKNQRDNIDRLLKQKMLLQNHLEVRSELAKEKGFELAKKAKDIEDLIKRLEVARQNQIASVKKEVPFKSGAFVRSKGNLPLPVRGTIFKKYNQMQDSGIPTKGMTILSRPGAQVIAPFDGTILFAAPFKGFGNLIIIEHSDGYHTLLSGLDEVAVTTGQSVLTGEPIGVMPSGNSGKLYLELRKDTNPIDPGNWFSFKKG